MSSATPLAVRPPMHHRLRKMVGRDPHEVGRTASPLELLYDLVFVAAFGLAGNQMAHLLAEGHWAPALGGFAFATFAIVWSWFNFTWMASAFDNDDWFFRITAMTQMIGVVILALGLPAMFHSLDAGEALQNDVMVIGYVVMRAGLVATWARIAIQDRKHRGVAVGMGSFLVLAQIGWVSLLFLREAPFWVIVLGVFVTLALDIGGPMISERKFGSQPWHPHHIAERLALLTIITLGEVILGTVTAVSAVIENQGWSGEAIIIVFGGVALAFALWWCYYMLPSAEILHAHRERGYLWGLGHIFIYASIAAAGAGLHVAAYVIEHEAHITTQQALLTVAIPVAAFLVTLFVLYGALLRSVDLFHILLFVLSIATIVTGVFLAGIGVSFGVSGLFVLLAPVMVIVGYEAYGYRHATELLERETS